MSMLYGGSSRRRCATRNLANWIEEDFYCYIFDPAAPWPRNTIAEGEEGTCESRKSEAQARRSLVIASWYDNGSPCDSPENSWLDQEKASEPPSRAVVWQEGSSFIKDCLQSLT